MKTGSHLKIRPFGDNVLGVELEGNPRKPEPVSFRVKFPGGEVDIERCENGSYWVHTLINEPQTTVDRYGPGEVEDLARVSEARLHISGKHTSEVDFGDFENPGLYDVALHVERLPA